MSGKHYTDKNADYFHTWQERQRCRENLPDFCGKTLDRVRKNAGRLNRQVEGSNAYNETLGKLRADKDKFYRQLKSVRKASPATQANCSHYTLESWKESQHGNRENYLQMQYPYDLHRFMLMALRLYRTKVEEGSVDPRLLSPNTKLRVVVIDEEYYEWLNSFKKKDTERSRLDYIENVSDADADRLLKKNHLDFTCSVCVIPFVVLYENGVPPITRWEMSEETGDVILSCLSRIYGEGNVFLPGIYGKADYLYSNRDKFLQQAANYFGNSVCGNVKQYKDCTQKHKGFATATFAGIPFVVRYVHSSASSTFGDILGMEGYSREKASLYPDKVHFLDSGDPMVPQEALNCPEVSFEAEGISAAISHDIEKAGVHVFHCGAWFTAESFREALECIQDEVIKGKR